MLLATAPGLRGEEKPSRCAFAADMRQLWEDHVTWTRLFLVEATAGLPSKDATTERLLRNQVDIGNAIKPFYGDEAGAKLTALLRDHILIAADLVTAAAAGDAAAQDAANRQWLANADEIAAFLTAANPREWEAEATRKMMRDHLELTTEEVVAHLAEDWEADIAAYERARAQILHMADMLSSGIVAQFPQKFTG
ncbi:MAG TPA: glycosyltransferase [Thermoanaerobaculia bacterium]|nr:glycosyltransferase [Thermoanaerobaculia bacterium]